MISRTSDRQPAAEGSICRQFHGLQEFVDYRPLPCTIRKPLAPRTANNAPGVAAAKQHAQNRSISGIASFEDAAAIWALPSRDTCGRTRV